MVKNPSLFVTPETAMIPKDITAAFPGDDITASLADGFYSYDLKKGANVIFSNGGDIKTQDITEINADVCYVWSNNAAVVDEDCDGKIQTTPAYETVDVKFAVEGWEKVYAYAWYMESGSADSEEAAPKTVTLTAGWPGDEITSSLADGFYKYALKKGANIIFNNGTAQTQDLEGINADVCYVWSTDKAVVDEDCDGTLPSANTVKVKFAVTGWEKVYVYAWEMVKNPSLFVTPETAMIPQAITAAFPGDDITASLADGFYSYDLKKGANVIFSNGTENAKTQNLEGIEADVCYIWTDGTAVLSEDCKLPDAPQMVYTIVGDAKLAGSNWDVNDAVNEMAKQEDGTYKLVKENVSLTAGDYKYKVVGNHSWDVFQLPKEGQGDNHLIIEEDGTYTVTFTFDGKETLAANAVKTSGTVVVKYYVAGSMNGWNPAGNELVDGKVVLHLSAGNYEFKITKGDWNWEANFDNVDKECSTAELTGNSGKNICFTLAEEQDVTIEYNAETGMICVKAETGVIDDVYVIAGESALLGSNWDGSDEANKMTVADGVATLVKEHLELAAKTYTFKVVKNGTGWIPDGMGNDSQLVIEEDGTYTVTFTYVLGGEAATAVAVKEGDTPHEKVYTIVGNAAIMNGTEDWAVESTDNDMTLIEGVYVLVVEKQVAAGTYEYKVAVNHAWKESYPAEGNETLTIEQDGLYRIVYSYIVGDDAPEATAELLYEPAVDKVYLIGHVEGTNYSWAANLGQEMTSLGAGLFTVKTTVADGDADVAYFGVTTKLGENADDWATVNDNRFGPEEDGFALQNDVPATFVKIANNSFKLDKGIYTIAIDMAKLTIVAHKETTALDQVDATASLVVENSTLVARFDGTQEVSVYNAAGQLVTLRTGNGEVRIPVADGLYIVMIGNEPFKAIVK